MGDTTRLILNGKGAADPGVRDAVGVMRDAGHDVEVRVTWERGDAARYAVEAESDGISRIIVGGGDGSINEVVNGLLEAGEKPDASLAILPLGTANDFATGCGIPTDSHEDALRLALEGEPVVIDAGKANDRYFINVASGGFPAEITAKTDPRLKKALGGVAYSLTGLFQMGKLTPYEGHGRGPDWEESGGVMLGAVGNGRLAGGGFAVAPRALLNDGLLDFAYIRDVPPDQLPKLIGELKNLGDTANEIAIYRQSPWIELELTDARQFNLDGEPVHDKRFRFEVVPGALQVVLGKDAPISTGAE